MYSDKNINDNIITDPNDTQSINQAINFEEGDILDPKYKSMGATN
jgi:hypothetical protein